MKAIYPRGFITPEGRKLSVKTLSNALSVIRNNPDAEYPGWNWFPTPGRMILKEFRRGLHERINMRPESTRKSTAVVADAPSVNQHA